MLPLALVIAVGAIIAYRWSVRSGQMDDLETPATRMLQDDVPRRRPNSDETPGDPAATVPSGETKRGDESEGQSR